MSIKLETKINMIDALKEMVRSMGMNPEPALNREALTTLETALKQNF